MVGHDRLSVRVDGGRRDEPGMAVVSDDHIPTAVVDVVVAGGTQQTPVVEICLTAVGPVHDVVGPTPGRGCAAFDAASVALGEGTPLRTGEQAFGAADREWDFFAVGDHHRDVGVACEASCGGLGNRAHERQRREFGGGRRDGQTDLGGAGQTGELRADHVVAAGFRRCIADRVAGGEVEEDLEGVGISLFGPTRIAGAVGLGCGCGEPVDGGQQFLAGDGVEIGFHP